MCITAKHSKMSATIVGGAVNHKAETHVLLYKNNVKNLSGQPNAMILPIMGEVISVVDTTDFNLFMDEIVKKTTRRLRGPGDKSIRAKSSIKTYKVGAYTIIEAKNATPKGMQKALATLPDNERPTISNELLAWYKEHYNNPTLLLCCFNGKETLSSQPIMIEYKPRNFNALLVPGADDHHGQVPCMGEEIDRDHTFIFGEYHKRVFGRRITLDFTQHVPKVIANAHWFSHGHESTGPNCDWAFVKYEENSFWDFEEVHTKEDVATLFS